MEPNTARRELTLVVENKEYKIRKKKLNFVEEDF